MKVCFFRSGKPREGLLADAFIEGVRQHGDDGIIRKTSGEEGFAEGCEVAVMVGVKSKQLFERHWRAGIHVIYLDKGYLRHIQAYTPVRLWEYWRVAVDGHHPTRTLMMADRPRDRLKALGLQISDWRIRGDHIVFAGSSAKYHEFYDLPEPTDYAQKIIKRIRALQPSREIVYRPKPSWQGAVPIKGTTWSGREQKIDNVLENAHCLVTHGSNACFEAVLAGIPCVILGEAVAKPISSTNIGGVADPKRANIKQRRQWLANLAYCQWTMPEFASGQAWAAIRPQLFGAS